MPRPPKNDKLSRRLIIRLNDEDRERIHANAQKADLRVSEYVRRVAVADKVEVRREYGYSLAVADQLRRIGVNLNQLMPIAHMNGKIPSELTQVWAKLDELLDRIISAM